MATIITLPLLAPRTDAQSLIRYKLHRSNAWAPYEQANTFKSQLDQKNQYDYATFGRNLQLYVHEGVAKRETGAPWGRNGC